MANPFDYILGPTGGLAYHFTALRYRHTRWRPFLEQVDRWLCEEWAPENSRIMIFGPSAGWTLSNRFLNRFDDIVLIEPDPLARLALGSRLGSRANLTLIARDDLLPWSEREPQSFETFLELYSSHALLFSNVLGQLALTDHARARTKANATETEDDHRDSTERFRQALAGREWASYHDLFSAEHAPLLTPDLEKLLMLPKDSTTPDAATLAQLAYPEGGELTDHEMLWLSHGHPTRLASWQLRPGRHHLIGFVYARADRPE